MYHDMFYSREEVRTPVPCPECGAKPGEKCIAARGKERLSNHMGRVNAFKATKVPE